MREAMTTFVRAAGALLVPVCLVCAAPAAGQISAVPFDPDAAEERLQAVSARLQRGGPENAVQPVKAHRSDEGIQLGPIRLTARPGFFEGHLLPRMVRYMHDVASVHSLETRRHQFENSSIHHRVSYEVEQRAFRATRKAARDYLYEITTLGARIDAIRVGHRTGGGGAERRGTKVGVELTHGTAKVGMRHSSAAGTTRFVVGLDRSVRLDFYPTRWNIARFYAGYEPERSVYRVAYRLGF